MTGPVQQKQAAIIKGSGNLGHIPVNFKSLILLPPSSNPVYVMIIKYQKEIEPVKTKTSTNNWDFLAHLYLLPISSCNV